ncbi:MAG: hypothetical protein GY771_13735 [bacterium]|nr:hypothetical protein [bacterium]
MNIAFRLVYPKCACATRWAAYPAVFIGILLFPESGFAIMTATGFGGVTEHQLREGGTTGVAFSIMRVFEVEAGMMWNGTSQWYTNAGFRFQAPLSGYDWFSPYLMFGVGKLGGDSTNQGGFGVNISVLRLDYRYIFIEETRADINRLYIGLEFEFGHFP